MKKKIIATITIISIIIILLVSKVYSNTTTRGAILVKEDGTNQKIEDSSIRVTQTIEKKTSKKVDFKVEVENLQEQGTEIAVVLDNSFSMWSKEKIIEYKKRLIEVINKAKEKIPDAYLSLSTYEGTIQQMTENKDTIIEAINNLTSYTGINSATGLNYAKESFSGKAKNKHIIVFTDTEETRRSKRSNKTNTK